MTERKFSRKYFRIKPEGALYAEMHIVQVESRAVRTRSSKVRILDISPGGLKFLSSLSFPLLQSIILEFRIKIADHTVCVKGYTVYKKQTEEDLYEYGVCFIDVDHSFRRFLLKLFNISPVVKGKYIVVLRIN